MAHAIGTDSRIGPHYLHAGVGFGGPSLEKHLLNLVYICETLELVTVAAYFQSIVKVNTWQKNRCGPWTACGLPPSTHATAPACVL